MAEQYNYPLFPGEKGIDFQKVDLATGVDYNLITESNARAQISILPSEISIFLPGTIFLMHAWAGNGVLDLNIRTRPHEKELPHPDFHAKRFISYALAHFESNGLKIHTFSGTWGEDSTNFRQYHEARSHGLAPAEAAKSTWSGRTMAQFGFTDIEDVDVVEFAKSPTTAPYVNAFFMRPLQ